MKTPTDTAAVRFLQRYEGLVWKIARSFAYGDADCDDLVQEISISLWTAYGQIPADVKESTFVYRVAFNRAVSWQRKRTTYRRHLQALFQSRQEAGAEDATSVSDVEALYRAIRELPELERSLILLYLERQSYAQMSEVLGVSQAMVGKRLSRAKKRLAKSMKRWEKNDEST